MIRNTGTVNFFGQMAGRIEVIGLKENSTEGVYIKGAIIKNVKANG
jgi:hypothetical protein